MRTAISFVGDVVLVIAFVISVPAVAAIATAATWWMQKTDAPTGEIVSQGVLLFAATLAPILVVGRLVAVRRREEAFRRELRRAEADEPVLALILALSRTQDRSHPR